MIRTWRRLDTMPACGEPTRRWLFIVARNVAIDAVRTTKARPAVVDLLDLTSLPSGEDTSETVVALQSLRQGFRSLSASHRAILTELYLRGRPVEETARHLGVPVGTVRSRAHYALRSLRRAIACPTEERSGSSAVHRPAAGMYDEVARRIADAGEFHGVSV